MVKEILANQRIGGWAFDVELSLLAKRAGFTLEEIPINWYYMTERKVKPMTDPIRMLREPLLIRSNVANGLYEEALEQLKD